MTSVTPRIAMMPPITEIMPGISPNQIQAMIMEKKGETARKLERIETGIFAKTYVHVR